MSKQPSRRGVLAAGAAVSAFSIVPSSVLGQAAKKKSGGFPDKKPLPPSERLNIGFVGAGGKAKSSIIPLMHHNIYALCDVDADRAAEAFNHFAKASRYEDWRVMLDKEAKNLDAVLVSTPDHTHAVSTMAAMQCGLPVYTEKPLTRTISEARVLSEYARKNNIVTQMGNQGHSTEGARLTNEWIQGGLLGAVTEVHCWSNRPIWPQGIVRPPAEQVPSTMNWDLWLGPAPQKPYSSKVAPFKWRAYWDYGAGALGDMAAHIMDHPVWALGLGAPLSVEVGFQRKDPASAKDTFPVTTNVTYKFAARGGQPALTLKWFDGKGNLPPRPEALEEERELPGNGVIYYGSENSMMHGSHGGVPRIFPETAMQAAARANKIPGKTMTRSPGHHEEWVQAIKANDPSMAKSNFGYAGPLTEMMLLGCVATRVGPGTKLTWDSEGMKTNNDVANRYIHHEYRKGWSL
ncbi:Putative oxidoreductase YteT [Pontiella desulfatans]|uniref:Oxidoreductase YteT n=1 Tax=Pontiella desulfatans TaxID=2750659 RepID=A0A6C2U9P2_PONDE|nr:Gfo/Idh/MocA family oxidoreductase [Pontiella desulfatans]VGO16104.1 Putative oxidoreductase YteT [Pontiella desulfatans]